MDHLAPLSPTSYFLLNQILLETTILTGSRQPIELKIGVQSRWILIRANHMYRCQVAPPVSCVRVFHWTERL